MTQRVLRSALQTEIDATFLYEILAANEPTPHIKEVFTEMADIENSHAKAFMLKYGIDQRPAPSQRAKFIALLGKVFGYDVVLSLLLNTEKRLASNIAQHRSQWKDSDQITDHAHVQIVQNLLKNKVDAKPSDISKFEKRHKSIGGNALRAAVLGGNDGLVSNFSLIMGVAGATSGQKEVLLAGMAGLLAGALSMALGEWISVKSSQELFENQAALEREELELNPEGELRELILIYMSKGIDRQKATEIATDKMKNLDEAHQILIKEELGISGEDLASSPWEAAAASFLLFAIGALIPLLPFIFFEGTQAMAGSIISSSFGLMGIGAVITLFTGKAPLKSGLRQMVFGWAAAALTFGIGKIVGVSIV